MDFRFKFILLAIFGVQVGNCQDCSWTAILSSSKYDVFAVNAPAEFSVSVTGVISDTERFSWYYNETVVSQFRYNISEDSLYQNLEFSRGTAKISKTGPNQVEFQLNFTTLATFDNNTVLQARKHGCSPTTQYSTPEYYIHTENCTKDSPGPANAVLTDPSATCQHLCKTRVNCSVDYISLSSMATCQFDTSWKDDCEPETTTPMPVTTAAAVNSTSVPCHCTFSKGQCTNCCHDSEAWGERSVVSCGEFLKCCVEPVGGQRIECTVDGFNGTLNCEAPEKDERAVSPGDIGGIALLCAFFLVAVAGVVAICQHYELSGTVKILYIICFIACVVGVLMSFLGSATVNSELNGIEIAGIVIASLGTIVGIVAVVLHFQGKNLSD